MADTSIPVLTAAGLAAWSDTALALGDRAGRKNLRELDHVIEWRSAEGLAVEHLKDERAIVAVNHGLVIAEQERRRS